MMSRIIIGCTIAVLSAGRAEAANVAVVVTSPGIFNLAILLIACACAGVGFKVLSAVRGGLLSRSWQFIVGGFSLLALAQLVTLLNDMEILSVPGWVVPVLLVAMSSVLFYGVFQTKQVLG